MTTSDQLNGVGAPDSTNPTQTSGGSQPDQARQVAQQAQQSASQVAQQVGRQASQIAQQAKSGAAQQFEQQRQNAAQTVDSVAQATGQFSQQLRQNNQWQIADFVDRAADQLQSVSSYMRAHDFNDMVDDANDFARRQPLLFLGGAVALGALAARFLKSSGSRTRRGSSYQYSGYPNQYIGSPVAGQYPSYRR